MHDCDNGRIVQPLPFLLICPVIEAFELLITAAPVYFIVLHQPLETSQSCAAIGFATDSHLPPRIDFCRQMR